MRSCFLSRYLGYLRQGVQLLLVDVHPQPSSFSFADALAEELQIQPPRLPAPLAISFRVGQPAPDQERFLAVWPRPLAVGEPLPTMPLPLALDVNVPVALEPTYRSAAAEAVFALNSGLFGKPPAYA